MTGSLVFDKGNFTKLDIQQAIRKYEQPDLLKAVWQLANTFIPYLALCTLMCFTYNAGYPYWVTMCLGIVAAGLLVRIFIFFHDCAHQSFFASRKTKRTGGI